MDVQFTFICQKRFSELEGKDRVARFCSDCNRHVINLDRLEKRAREEILEIAALSGLKLCVSARAGEKSSGPSCSELPSRREEYFSSAAVDLLCVGEVRAWPYTVTTEETAKAEDRVTRILEEQGSSIRREMASKLFQKAYRQFQKP